MDSAFDLSGRRALVTGASAGIGAAISIRLAEAGARVVGVSRSGQVPRTTTKRGELIPLQADLAIPTSPNDVIRRTVETLGGLDIVINNAGKAE